MFERLKGFLKTAKQKAIPEVQLSTFFKMMQDAGVGDSTFLEQYSKSIYVFRCVETIARKVSTIELRLFQILNSKGDVQEVLNHEALDLLWNVNPFQTRSEFLKITIINKKLTGDAFWIKVRNDNGQIAELWNLRPDCVSVLSDPEQYIKGYKFTKADGTFTIFAPEDIVHIKDPSPTNQFRGVSPLSAARTRVETEAYATYYQRDFFKNNARPDFLLITDENLTLEQQSDMEARWKSKHEGRTGKQGKMGVLEGGLKYQQVSISQREMDYIESLKFTRDDILVAFGVPKSIITTDDVNLANAETGMFVFLSESIKPEMQTLVDSINQMLIEKDFGEQYYLDFVDPTPENRTMRLNEFTQGVDKWMTINEIRNLLNLEPIEGGDSLYRPLGVVPIGEEQDVAEPIAPEGSKAFKGRGRLKMKFEMKEMVTKTFSESLKKLKVKPAGKPEEKKTAEPQAKKKFRRLFDDAGLRQTYYYVTNEKIDKRAKRFKTEIQKAARAQQRRILAKLNDLAKAFESDKTKALGPETVRAIFNIEEENKIFATIALPFMKSFMEESGQDALDTVGAGLQFALTPALQDALVQRAEFFAESANNTTLDKLSATLAEGIGGGEGIAELTNRVVDVYDEFSDYRAERIARTETTAVNNEGFIEGYQQSRVVEGKEWVATGDDRTRDSHLAVNGEIVNVNENFSNGLMFPGDEDGDPAETVNCRCVIAPVVTEE